MRNTVWTDNENAALAAAFVDMRSRIENGEKVNKAQVNRELRAGALAARSRGAVEAKLMNLSAVAAAEGDPICPGYKAAGNYQASLRDAYIAARDSYGIVDEVAESIAANLAAILG